MRFGLFYEHQLPRPWAEGDEQKLYQEALDQVELADRLGFDCVWEVEHQFLDEYSHSSAPEIFLAACSQRTRQIRLGHGIVLMPPPFNHPAKVAARIATLDVLSNGRVEWGTGTSSSRMELEGFNIHPKDKQGMYEEAVDQCTNMMVLDPYPGYQGKYFSMPCRNVLPKPIQKPHPPMWVACSTRQTVLRAAQMGLGALTFAFLDVDEARYWVAEYYREFKENCVPISHVVNPNIATISSFMCHEDGAEAERRGTEGVMFLYWALGYYYRDGTHQPGYSKLWERFQKRMKSQPREFFRGVGTPEQIRQYHRDMEGTGLDQLILLQTAGRNQHQHICESMELYAREVLPEFKQRAVEREKQKAEELAPYVEAALARKKRMPPMADADIPVVPAYGLVPAPEAPKAAAPVP